MVASTPTEGHLSGTQTACPLCGGQSRQLLVATDRNRGVSDDAFPYRECARCGTVFIADPPADLGGFYTTDYHDEPDRKTRAKLLEAERDRLRMLLEHIEPGRLTEIGPSYGLFAGAAREAGFDVTAIEMDAEACAKLESSIGITAINSDRPEQALRELPPSRVVIMWHALEHLREPWVVLESAAANLENGGVLGVATPNPRSLQFGIARRRWAHLDAPRHLFLVPPDALIERAGTLGLRLLEITSTDPVGRMCNQMGWVWALMANPARRRRPTRLQFAVAHALELLAAPVERQPTRGSTYTALFVKDAR
jgi:2-polyprenyl-3-methyl-5-hydroxy-6-metoxy-1,4-benzoquinol methylase